LITVLQAIMPKFGQGVLIWISPDLWAFATVVPA
jgi:hypothetical protein